MYVAYNGENAENALHRRSPDGSKLLKYSRFLLPKGLLSPTAPLFHGFWLKNRRTPTLAHVTGDTTKYAPVATHELSVVGTAAELTARGGAKDEPPAVPSNLAQTAKVGFYFFLWYAFNGESRETEC